MGRAAVGAAPARRLAGAAAVGRAVRAPGLPGAAVEPGLPAARSGRVPRCRRLPGLRERRRLGRRRGRVERREAHHLDVLRGARRGRRAADRQRHRLRRAVRGRRHRLRDHGRRRRGPRDPGPARQRARHPRPDRPGGDRRDPGVRPRPDRRDHRPGDAGPRGHRVLDPLRDPPPDRRERRLQHGRTLLADLPDRGDHPCAGRVRGADRRRAHVPPLGEGERLTARLLRRAPVLLAGPGRRASGARRAVGPISPRAARSPRRC